MWLPRQRRLDSIVKPFAALALALVGALASLPARAAADQPRLFVVDLSKDRLPAPYTDVDLASEVGRTLNTGGCQVDRACKAADCLKDSLAATGVHVMTFNVSYDRQRYSCAVAVEVRERAAGRLLYKENSSSAVCPAADLLEHTQRAARVACEELRKGEPAASTPAPPAPKVQVAARTITRTVRPSRGLPIAALGAGVGAVTAGAVLLYMDGSGTDCFQTRGHARLHQQPPHHPVWHPAGGGGRGPGRLGYLPSGQSTGDHRGGGAQDGRARGGRTILMVQWSRWRVPLSILLALAAGCTDRLNPGRCKTSSDCPSHEMCDVAVKTCVARAPNPDPGGRDGRRDGPGGDGGDASGDGSETGNGTGDGNGQPIPTGPDAAPDVIPPDAANTCAEDRDCTTGVNLFCVMNACVSCSMAPANTCATKGPGNNKSCNMMTGACVECLGPAECMVEGKRFCVANACAGCASAPADACKAPTPVCDMPGGSCVECTTAAHCKDPTKPFCAASKCVACGMAPAGQTCATLDATKPACDATTGACIECNTSADCTATAKPICVNKQCVACTGDAQCVAKAASPGICLAHLDGRCASEAETIHVRKGSGCGGNAGTAAQPVCKLDDARALITASRRVVLVKGLVDAFAWTLPSGGPITIVGQQSADIAELIKVGARLSGTGEVVMRDLTISRSNLQGIVAGQGVTLRLDRVRVQNNAGGGILLDRARFHLKDTQVTNNGPGEQGATFWGGILVLSPPPGGATLERVSLTFNQQVGMSCSTPVQGMGVLAINNVGGDVASACDVSTCSSAGPACGANLTPP